MNNVSLYLLTVAIWGSTWLSIKYEIGVVPPVQSVFYRFLIAALIMQVVLRLMGKMPRFTPRTHLAFALLGLSLFCTNYIGFYLATSLGLTTGLEAVIFSLLIFMNALNLYLFWRVRPAVRVMMGGLLGLIGVVLLFGDDVSLILRGGDLLVAIALSFFATFSASLGNMVSRHLQKETVRVEAANAWGMTYGTLALFFIVLATGSPWRFDFSLTYVGNLLYLAVFGSVFAFWAYLTLLGRIGADKAAYSTILIPVIALALSSLFEGYTWSLLKLVGVAMVVLGNLAVMGRLRWQR